MIIVKRRHDEWLAVDMNCRHQLGSFGRSPEHALKGLDSLKKDTRILIQLDEIIIQDNQQVCTFKRIG